MPGEPAAEATGCRPPADVRREVELYDERAEAGTWDGPRYRMTYRILGEGPPLIWIPGIAATYRVYAMVLNRLSERFRTIQYAYPGDEPADGARLGAITHEHLADDLFGLIDHLRLGRTFLVGLSFGSTVLLRAIAREPRRFPRSVVQGAFARRRFTAAERLALALGRRIPGPASRLPLRETVLTYNSKPDFPAVLADRWPFYLEQNGATPIRALAHRTAMVAGLDLRPIAGRVASELLLVQGREDRIVPYRYFEELKGLLPRSESVVMPTVGHIPHLTHAEVFARLIGEWLVPCNEGGQCSRDAATGPAEGPRS
ncbi:2-hydroxy-6-oxononadienedioate/2-hydroxy-6-oxononatrienedioate hydrolase [Aquisphaera giovannonii]|uniref:2-hydroxy-6-oxononadienedioate/2-hydroxy-6-oxononatrienedioate hydrolase n=1 Tax=Aquisphaera giovannonii TaxID=406548 RepID=A0A5B9W197_9BACT|nr:alpha/beta hydrolase [Aquisphaera giovannonii]QEH34004.1 2-hydroxy-6-oxononadienedioate/2-hydroxy-6-oxononatrienedioate hydrolase [Aquisphaera giovannonii]